MTLRSSRRGPLVSRRQFTPRRRGCRSSSWMPLLLAAKQVRAPGSRTIWGFHRHPRPGAYGARFRPGAEIWRRDGDPGRSRRPRLLAVPYGIQLADGRRVKGSTVVVASGARYRRPDIPRLREFEGAACGTGPRPSKRACAGTRVALVGGGNSAGQAAVFLRDFAAKVWMLVRGPSLAESMSQYLIDRIAAADNIEVLTETEITVSRVRPKGSRRVRWRNRAVEQNGEAHPQRFHLHRRRSGNGLAQGLRRVGLDAKGFVRTGAALTAPA